MTNTNKLKAKLAEKGYTLTMYAKKLNKSKASISQKVNNKLNFSQEDIKKSVDILDLEPCEIKDIFLM